VEKREWGGSARPHCCGEAPNYKSQITKKRDPDLLADGQDDECEAMKKCSATLEGGH